MICLFLGAVLCGGTAAAQHTLGVTGGYGYGNARFYPKEETRVVWGCYTAGVTWRYYGPQRFVGGFGHVALNLFGDLLLACSFHISVIF